MLKVSGVLQLIETHHKLTVLLIKKEKAQYTVVTIPSVHYLLSLHSSLITSLGWVASATCHCMICIYSPHTDIVIDGFSAYLILAIFRPGASYHVEEGMRKNEQGEGKNEHMMASWGLIVRDSPWF